jgi:hypothetical protein
LRARLVGGGVVILSNASFFSSRSICVYVTHMQTALNINVYKLL